MHHSTSSGYNLDPVSQINVLQDILATSSIVSTILQRAPKLGLPDWYLGAGVIAQTVWNYHHKFTPVTGIKDADLVYFDHDLSMAAEQAFQDKARELFHDLPVEVEVTNEARVHLWYEAEFQIPLDPYTSSEDAINSWPSTATSIGVRQNGKQLEVYAPYGLHDLLNMVVRPNKTQITKTIYEAKAVRWQKVWPKLTIIPW